MTIFNPTVTEVGQAAAFNVESTGIEVVITHIAFGLGSYDPTGAEIALVNEVVRVPVAAGARITPTQIRMNAVWNDAAAVAPINEVGIYAGDTLFAIWSSSAGAMGYKSAGVDFVFNYSMLLTVVPAGSVTVIADSGTSAVLAALMSHEGAENPHPQYMMRRRRIWVGAAGGTANALALTIPAEDAIAALEIGQGFLFIAAANNIAGGVTIDVGGIATIDLKKQGGIALDPNDLSVGAIYEAMYDGANAQLVSGNGGGGGGAVNTFSPTEFTATAAQTTFPVAYTVGNIMVMVDGEQQPPSSYTATDGANVVFAPGLTAGQKVLVLAFSPFTVANVVDLTNNQNVGGIKTFLSSPNVPTVAAGDATTKVASTAQVAAAITARVATILVAGIARLANNTTDVAAVGTGGGSPDIALTPAALAAVQADTSKRGIVELATDAEAQSFSGLLNKLALTVSNLVALRASAGDMTAGTTDQRFTTPKGIKDAGYARIFESAYQNYHGYGSGGGIIKQLNFVNPSGLRVKHFEFYARCKVATAGAQQGWHVLNDVIPLNSMGMSHSGSNMQGFASKLYGAVSENVSMFIDANHGIAAHDWNGDNSFLFDNDEWEIKCVFFV